MRGADVAISWANLLFAAVRITRTLDAILNFRESSSRTEFMSKSMPLDGLATKSMAPNSRAFSVVSAPSRDSELTITIGRGLVDMMTSVACSPSMCGILMSMVITSGVRASDCATASLPSRASPTTSMFGSADKMLTSTLRMKAESSATSTRIRFVSAMSRLLFSLLRSRCCSRCFVSRDSCGSNQLRYRCYKLIILHRLGHERHGAFFHRAFAMLGTGARRNHHNGYPARLRILFHVRHQLVTIGAGHFQISDHQIAARLAHDLQRFQAVGSQAHTIAGFFQHAPDELAYADGIIGKYDHLLRNHVIDCFRRNAAGSHSDCTG